VESWKVRNMAKGALTWVPGLHALRLKYASMPFSDSARYCYTVWLRHWIRLRDLGVSVNGASIGELGPGNSLGIGLAALLCGATRYCGLDLVPFASSADLDKLLAELHQLFIAHEALPGETEFPEVCPKLDSYDFPRALIEEGCFADRVEQIAYHLKSSPLRDRGAIRYIAPWTSVTAVEKDSLDLVISQAVLEHVDDLEETYHAMYAWLRCGGYGSHVISFYSHRLSPIWNGHWAYSDWEWRLVRGGRRFLINREPLQTHVELAMAAGFEIVHIERYYDQNGYTLNALAPRYGSISTEDAKTRAALVVLKKPQISRAQAN
jgi:hypothetical protein